MRDHRDGDRYESPPAAHPPAPAGPGSEIVVKATGGMTRESFFMSGTTIASGFAGPPAHRHQNVHDMFYVLEGTLHMRLGDRHLELPAGGFVCVPPGVIHTFSNPGPSSVRFLNFNTPAGWENYMRDLGRAAADGPLSTERIGQIASRYDFEAVDADAPE
jgi:mannose-6-phosphate isomerase-like protein (cupin superfamily)